MDRDRNKWKEIQQRAFTNWFNDRLRGNLKVAKQQVHDLKTDLKDGLLIITLLEHLAKPRKIGRYTRNATNKLHCIENIGASLRFTKSENIKLVNIGELKRIINYEYLRCNVNTHVCTIMVQW